MATLEDLERRVTALEADARIARENDTRIIRLTAAVDQLDARLTSLEAKVDQLDTVLARVHLDIGEVKTEQARQGTVLDEILRRLS